MATADAQNTPMAERWGASFKARYKREPGFDAQQAYDSVRTLAHAIQKAKTTDAPKVIERMKVLDPDFVELAGRRALRQRPHAALRQPRHPQGEERGLHLGAVAAHRFAGVRLAALVVALRSPSGRALARADGDPASDVLIKRGSSTRTR